MRRNILKISVAIISALLLSSMLAVSAFAGTLWREDDYSYSEEYKSSKYYQNRISVKPTGDMRTDILAIALSQIGYHEGNSRADMHGLNNSGNGNYVEFNRLSGIYDPDDDYGYAWCAAFVNWSLYEAKIPSDLTGGEISCHRWIRQFFTDDSIAETEIYKHSLGYDGKATYIPRSGDIVFFRNIGSGTISTHVGLVRYCDGTKVYTIEGNTSSQYMDANGGQVCIKEYAIGDPYIVGYGTPKYTEKEDVPKVDYSGKTMTTGLYISSNRIAVYKTTSTADGNVGSIAIYMTFTASNINGDWYYISGVDTSGDKVEGWARIKNKCYQLTNDGRKTYSISFASSDEDISSLPSEQLKVEGGTITITNKTPYKMHYEFLGWTDVEGSDEVKYKGGDEYTEDADITLYPVFEKIKVTVNFVYPDGEVIEEVTGDHGDPLTPPTVAVDPGFKHTGWNTDIPETFKNNATYVATIEEDPDYVSEPEKKNGCGASLSMCALFAIVLAPAAILTKRKKK